ncbi:MAG: tetratricopeptide repeat protein [Pseudomonadota bacterium]
MDALFESPWAWVVSGALVVALVYGALLLWQRYTLPLTAPALRDPFVDGLVALAEGDLGAAGGSLERAIELTPEAPWSYLALGVLLCRQGDRPRAARLLQGVLARTDLPGPLAAAAHESLVEVLASDGRLAEAQAWARSLHQPAGMDAVQLERRARVALAARAHGMAHQLATQLERLDRDRGRLLAALELAARAEDLADDGKPAEALKLLKKARARDDSIAAVWALEGQLRLDQGDLERARHALAEAVVRERALALTVLPLLEDAHFERGKVADYEALLHELLERGPRDPLILWALGEHHARRNHLDEAGRVLDEALALAPDFELARQALQQVHARQHGQEPVTVQGIVVRTRCAHCGTADVRGIVRCPACGFVGEILFASALPALPSGPALRAPVL